MCDLPKVTPTVIVCSLPFVFALLVMCGVSQYEHGKKAGFSEAERTSLQLRLSEEKINSLK